MLLSNYENRKYQYILVSDLDHQVRVVDDRRVFRELLVGDCPLLELLCWVGKNTHRVILKRILSIGKIADYKTSEQHRNLIFFPLSSPSCSDFCPTSCDLPVVGESSAQRDGNVGQVAYLVGQTVHAAVHPAAAH